MWAAKCIYKVTDLYSKKKLLSYEEVKAAVGNFGVKINYFFVFYWKRCHNTHRQPFVSDVVREYGEIFVFSHHASVLRTGKNPDASVLFAQSVMLSVLSVLIGWTTLRVLATGDISTSPLAVCVLCLGSTKVFYHYRDMTQYIILDNGYRYHDME